jgi:hypothetical protein
MNSDYPPIDEATAAKSLQDIRDGKTYPISDFLRRLDAEITMRALIVRMEAMKAENARQARVGGVQTYDEVAFQEIADQLIALRADK